MEFLAPLVNLLLTDSADVQGQGWELLAQFPEISPDALQAALADAAWERLNAQQRKDQKRRLFPDAAGLFARRYLALRAMRDAFEFPWTDVEIRIDGGGTGWGGSRRSVLTSTLAYSQGRYTIGRAPAPSARVNAARVHAPPDHPLRLARDAAREWGRFDRDGWFVLSDAAVADRWRYHPGLANLRKSA